jgi:hypothetical protein
MGRISVAPLSQCERRKGYFLMQLSQPVLVDFWLVTSTVFFTAAMDHFGMDLVVAFSTFFVIF